MLFLLMRLTADSVLNVQFLLFGYLYLLYNIFTQDLITHTSNIYPWFIYALANFLATVYFNWQLENYIFIIHVIIYFILISYKYMIFSHEKIKTIYHLL